MRNACECTQICDFMWIWEMALVAVVCALQAIHNRWWNLASRPALWSFPPPAAACFPRTHLCCWPRVVCACVSEGEREGEKPSPYVTVFAHKHSTSIFPFLNMSDLNMKTGNFFITLPPCAHMATEPMVTVNAEWKTQGAVFRCIQRSTGYKSETRCGDMQYYTLWKDQSHLIFLFTDVTCVHVIPKYLKPERRIFSYFKRYFKKIA